MISKNRLKYLRSLKERKFRQKEGRFLIDGVRLVDEAAHSDWTIDLIVYTSDFLASDVDRTLLKVLEKRNVELVEISQKELERISTTVTSQGILGVVRAKRYDIDNVLSGDPKVKTRVVAVEKVADPGNLGTIIRTCDWFGVDLVLLSLGTVEVLNPKVVRATMGSLFHIPVVENVELANELKRSKERDYKVYVTDLQGKAEYSNVDFSCKSVVVFGNEAWGVAPGITELADLTIRISQIGRADSLNVAVACGVILSRAQMH